MKKTQTIIGVIIGLSVVFGIVAGIDARYAKSAVVEQVSERLERKIDGDRMNDLQAKMWDMEDRWAERFQKKYDRIHDDMDELLHFMTKEDRARYRELEKEYEELREKNRPKKKAGDED